MGCADHPRLFVRKFGVYTGELDDVFNRPDLIEGLAMRHDPVARAFIRKILSSTNPD